MAAPTTTMKALVKTKEGKSFEYLDVPIPEPSGDEVLIKVDAVSVCGSDINLYSWNQVAQVIASIPFTPGHECAGTVVKCGPDVKGVAVGARVGVENHYYCGECYQCQHDTKAICKNMGQFGHGKKTPYGGCSEYTIVPAKYLYQLTRNIDADEIAMLEPLGVAHNAVERLEVAGEDVLVIGCGPVGLLVLMVAKALGAKRVVSADIDQSRLDMAKSFGADAIFNTKDKNLKEFVLEFTNGDGMGRICECSGASSMVNLTFSMLRKGGQMTLVGLPKEPLHVENVLQDVVFKALTLKTIHGRQIYHTWVETEKLVADGKIDVKKVITSRFPMSRYEDAFKALFEGKDCKIVLYPSQ